jgi:hypothetical protein
MKPSPVAPDVSRGSGFGFANFTKTVHVVYDRRAVVCMSVGITRGKCHIIGGTERPEKKENYKLWGIGG